MARIRTVKPSFFTSLTIADLTVEQRLTFIGLWTHSDDEGRSIYDPRLIKAALWPLDDRTAADIADDVRALTESSLMTHYIVRERSYLVVNTWSEHQRINRPVKSTLPAPSEGQIVPLTSSDEPSRPTHGALTESSPWEGKGKEWKGKDSATRVATAPTPDHAPNAATLIGEWIDRCPERPPGRVVGQLSKEIKALLTEGIPVDTVRQGIEAWQSKSLHPSTLASVVHEVRNPATARPTSRRPTTDDRVQDGMALARRLAAEEANRLEIGA